MAHLQRQSTGAFQPMAGLLGIAGTAAVCLVPAGHHHNASADRQLGQLSENLRTVNAGLASQTVGDGPRLQLCVRAEVSAKNSDWRIAWLTFSWRWEPRSLVGISGCFHKLGIKTCRRP